MDSLWSRVACHQWKSFDHRWYATRKLGFLWVLIDVCGYTTPTLHLTLRGAMHKAEKITLRERRG